MSSIVNKLPYNMKPDEADFSKDLLLLMLTQKSYNIYSNKPKMVSKLVFTQKSF